MYSQQSVEGKTQGCIVNIDSTEVGKPGITSQVSSCVAQQNAPRRNRGMITQQ